MIYKYKVKQLVKLPKDSRILTAGYQDRQIVIWVEMGTAKEVNTVEFLYVGTGWDEPTAYHAYINTVTDPDGFVWHVFYRIVNV